MERIKNINQIKQHTEDYLDCFISLANGMVRSSKEIIYNTETNTFTIFHSISGANEELTEKEFKTTNIFEALQNNNLYKY
tara:strand:+ start:101 stop:340 length:240 start_codon:yes stop_codon:yes gene_type:complete